MEKKNEIFITKHREGYSLHYNTIESCTKPQIVINSRGFYNIINGLIEFMPKNIYKEGIKKVYLNDSKCCEFSKEEKEIFEGLINALEKSAKEKNLEDKIKEIRNILIHKENTEKFLKMERARNEEKSFNSLYKTAKK